MNQKIISIEITPENESVITQNGGVMWEHNAGILKFTLASNYIGDYRYYLEYRSLMGTKTRTEYLELNPNDNTITYPISATMTSLKGVECYFNIVKVDEDGNTVQVIKPRKFGLTFDYSPETDNSLCKEYDFSINSLLEAIRLGTFKGDRGEKGEKGDKGDKGETGGISEDYATSNFANTLKGSASGESVVIDDISPIEHKTRVCVHGKNLFDISKIDTVANITNNKDGTITVTTTANSSGVSTGKTLKQLAPQLKVGKTYVLSAESTGATKIIYVNSSWAFGKSITMTEQMLNSQVIFYASGVNTTAIVSNIQIEDGETVTEYTPYIDVSTVTVTEETTGTICTLDADGVCDVVSVYPVMTLSTDTDGIIVEVEYNKDTNRVIGDISLALTEIHNYAQGIINGGVSV